MSAAGAAYMRRVEMTHELIKLLLAQRKYDEAQEALARFERYVDWSVEQLALEHKIREASAA